MTNKEYEDLLQKTFDAWDRFAEPGREFNCSRIG
mgnify:CR=1 FL=1